MSDRMTAIPFNKLMEHILEENRNEQTIFGVSKYYKANLQSEKLQLFNEGLELPFGPAAGPHTQLAQNIIAAYVGGSRFFELKTVQTLDGEDLPVAKPCILAEDEGYNVEWSTELRVQDAQSEYIKAYFALKLISRELELGCADGFIFNMSVGYDLEGIRSAKIDAFIEGLKDASELAVFKECKAWAYDNLHCFKNITKADIDAIDGKVCTSGTLSTLHGCPPAEIERIATYLLSEKHLNTFIKCNPTLLGYKAARETLDALGYDYIVFDEHHFNEDLQFADAVPMLTRLQALANEKSLSFGVKLTNTFPVDIAANELPGNEMYMSGRSLFPLSMQVAQKLTLAFDGALRISYSGGADAHNIADLYKAGIWPITIATTLLKPGGYNRLVQMASLLEKVGARAFTKVDLSCVEKLMESSKKDLHYIKPIKTAPNRKSGGEVPLIDCFKAPCRGGCPFGQDIPAYLRFVDEGKYEDALNVILERNPLPFITGTICAHHCMDKCTRGFYDESVHIRDAKLKAANNAFDTLLKSLTPRGKSNKNIAIVGGGPAGMAAAYLLARGGAKVTIFDKHDTLGGVVRQVIPEFRIASDAIEKDAALLKAMGVNLNLNTEISSKEQLQSYDAIVLGIGAWDAPSLKLDGADAMDALEFLAQCKAKNYALNLGKNVVIIGGGNTAMDAARAAKRVKGVECVSLVYRRNRRYMPADEEELELCIADGVEFVELASPEALANGVLTCEVMALGAPDASGRRAPVGTGKKVQVSADTVIAAVGEKVDNTLYNELALALDGKGRIVVNSDTLETSRPNVYAIGDGRRGAATVAEAIADANIVSEALLSVKQDRYAALNISDSTVNAMTRRGEVCEGGGNCLECATVCEACVDVCPNRANVAIKIDGYAMPQIIHVDGMCNECGNCATFCPYEAKPYKDKFTLYWTMDDFNDSDNAGFYIDRAAMCATVRLGGNVAEYYVNDTDCGLMDALRALIIAVSKKDYLFN